MQIWKDIKDYEGLYQISNYGVVRSLPRKVKGRYKEYIRPRRILERIRDRFGFYRVSLRKDGKNRKFHTHRLVAQHFVPNPEGKKRVKFKNDIKTDVRDINLEWK